MESLGFNQLLDVLFVILVTASCWLSLSSSSDRNEGRTKEWKRELEDLRRSLELLINEAGTASRNLDKNLAERHEQLTQLLAKIESSPSVINAAAAPAPQTIAEPRQATIELKNQDEFDPDSPNPSWGTSRPAQQAAEEPSGLREQIEISKEDQRESNKRQKREITVQRKLTIDPLAARVAKRLLLRGQEIHIVARKLDLSLSVVRVLDRELREENPEYRGSGDDDFQALEPADEIYSADIEAEGAAAQTRGRG
ncbi:MAG: hypothetical protein KDD66_12135 [Bdellovibrionales bacterium]|nr:hypothetical protein [Bdellovibrionales bacterium]